MAKNVFIYSYGRVASTCVFKSVVRHCPAQHFHNLPPEIKVSDATHLISGIREPISRGISAFFTWMHKRGNSRPESQYAGYGKYFVSEDEDRILEMPVEDLVARFMETLHVEDVWKRDRCWFDMNIGKNFGIDVYAGGFGRGEDFAVLKGEAAPLLLYKQEALERSGAKAIGDFLQVDGFNLDLCESETPWYAEARNKFMRHLAFSEEDLDKVYDNPKVKSFYDDEEILSFKKRWLGLNRKL